jgi:acyl-CoA synthetase (AMP-forming)/AMP-acid ligase II
LRYGIKETTGKDFENMIFEGDYLFIKYDTNEIVKILINACEWLVKYVYIKDPTSPKGAFFEEHKALFFAFLEETKKILLDYCRQHIAKYAMPYDITFKDEMPKTLVGKVAYRVLEEEELAKHKEEQV